MWLAHDCVVLFWFGQYLEHDLK